MDYGDNLYEQIEIPYFSYLGYREDGNHWQWKDCILSLDKVTNEQIRFFIRRNKVISLPNNTKLRWDQKRNNITSKLSEYLLHYVIHFDVNISDLPESIVEDKIQEQLTKNQFGDYKDAWILYLDTRHRIWTWKDTINDTKIVMNRILDSINKKRSIQYFESNYSDVNNSIVKSILPVVYHPSRDLRGVHNYIQEIHLNRSKTDKIQVTIVYNNEQLRKHKFVDGIYKLVRKILHGRSFDVESFSITLDKNSNASKFNFPYIYSGDNKLEDDNIHVNKYDIDIRFFFNRDISKPILFINTSNHAMAEKDNNYDKWKVEYRLWEEQVPVYVGENSRCEIEKYLSNVGLRNLFGKCNDINYY